MRRITHGAVSQEPLPSCAAPAPKLLLKTQHKDNYFSTEELAT